MKTVLISFIFLFLTGSMTRISAQAAREISIKPVSLDAMRPARYARSFRDLEGNVHMMGLFRISVGEDGRLYSRAQNDPVFPPAVLTEGIMNTFFSRPGVFIALGNRLEPVSGYKYSLRMWRSADDLKTISEDTAWILLPEAGKVDFGRPGEWAGLFCHRAILQLADGSLITAMYGNFEIDTIRPTNPQSRLETKYKLRAFVVRSTDNGYTWNYLSSVAVPHPELPDDSEGFNEWTMVQLLDGRILAVIRTGHFTPMVTSLSSDQGKTWSVPAICSELGPAGCDPYLLRLGDGRIALSYGDMVQPPAGDIRYFENFHESGDTRRRCRLAISLTPAASHWQAYDITGFANRSAYSSIFEMKPGLLLYQSDLELYEVEVH